MRKVCRATPSQSGRRHTVPGAPWGQGWCWTLFWEVSVCGAGSQPASGPVSTRSLQVWPLAARSPSCHQPELPLPAASVDDILVLTGLNLPGDRSSSACSPCALGRSPSFIAPWSPPGSGPADVPSHHPPACLPGAPGCPQTSALHPDPGAPDPGTWPGPWRGLSLIFHFKGSSLLELPAFLPMATPMMMT